jgi:diaminopimelate decarboxylase
MDISNLITPSFILNEERLKENYNNLVNAFQNVWNNTIIGYSYKTNSLPWFISWMKKNNALAEVVSTQEYELAKYIGYCDSRIILNGPNKGFESISNVLNNGGIVNLDSFHEINWLKDQGETIANWKVGLRVNFDLEKYCPEETLMGDDPGRFGFNYENGDFHKAISILKKIKNVSIVGIHLHNSTKTKSLKIFQTLAEKACQFSEDIPGELEYVDIGGGFFGDKPGAPTYDDYAKCIVDELKKKFNYNKTTLIIEPGISLAASCFDYLCEVVDIKDRKNSKLLTTNGSLMNLDPQMNNRSFSYSIIPEPSECTRNIINEQIVCGFTCMEKDRLLKIHNREKLRIGDKFLFQNAGAYTLTFIPMFIEYLPPVYLFDGHNYSTIREKWGVNEYVQKSIIE